MKPNGIHLTILLTTLLAACGGSEAPTVTSDAAKTAAPAVAPTASPKVLPEISAEEVLAQRLVGYEARSLDGSTFRLADQKGKVVLVNAWATWCGPCRYEIPELKRLYMEHEKDGLVIVGVSVDMAPAEPAVREFVKVNDIAYPILLDPQSRLTAMLRSTSIPTTVLMDREGKVVWRHVGIVSEQRDSSFRDALSKALGS